MYFFACDFDDVVFGWIRGNCQKGEMYETAYKWLAQYCEFFPPLWVSLDEEKLTGYSAKSSKVLFGFKFVNGFPVKYDAWMIFLGILINLDTNNFRYIDERLVEELDIMERDGETRWSHCHNLDNYLKSYVFVNDDQFVVPSLDLRQSQTIVCSDEAQRGNLIRKGFQGSKIKVASVYSRSKVW